VREDVRVKNQESSDLRDSAQQRERQIDQQTKEISSMEEEIARLKFKQEQFAKSLEDVKAEVYAFRNTTKRKDWGMS